MDTPTLSPEHVRAADILEAGTALLELIEADNAARAGAGGPVQSATTLHASLTYGLMTYAQAFNLPYGGPTQPMPAQPTGGV